MRLAIMQPYFFPYIGYWQLIGSVDTFVIYDDVNYINKGYVNRNDILLKGCRHRFTLELMGASQNRKINEICVGTNREKLLKTFRTAYAKAPFFSDVFPLIENVIEYPEENLARYLGYSIKSIMTYLDIKTTVVYSSELVKNNDLKGQKKILDITKRLHATHYINPEGGRGLYCKTTFEENGLRLDFLKSASTTYSQFQNAFEPSLSIIDVMMFNSNDALHDMLTQYHLMQGESTNV